MKYQGQVLRRYTRLTIFGHDFLRIRFIHLRLLRRRPFWAHGGKIP